MQRTGIIIAGLLIQIYTYAQTTFTWNGSASSDWNTAANWTPSFVPAPPDHVIIVSTANDPVLDTERTVTNFTINNGTLNLSGFTLHITGDAVASGGEVNNGLLDFGGASVNFSGTSFGAAINASCAEIRFNGSLFNAAVNATQTGSAATGSSGGNTFNGITTITNTGDGSMVLADGSPDIYNNDVTFNTTGNGLILVSYNSTGNTFAGTTTFNNSSAVRISVNQQGGSSILNGNVIITSTGGQGVHFGSANGTVSLSPGNTITIGAAGFSAGELRFQRFTQSGSTAQNLILTGSASLGTYSNSQFNGTIDFTAPKFTINETTFNGNLTIEQTGAIVSSSAGGNVFNGITTITNSGDATFFMADYFADTYNNDVTYNASAGATFIIGFNTMNNTFSGTSTFNNTGTGNIFVSMGGSSVFNGNIIVNSQNGMGVQFGSGTGSAALAEGKTITTGLTGFNSGTLSLNAFTQNGTTLQNLTLTGTARLVLSGNSSFAANVNFTSPGLVLDGCTFHGTASLEKTGTGNDVSSGGNIFNGITNIKNSGSGYLLMGGFAPDVFNNDVTFENTGSNSIFVAYSSQINIFNGITTFSNTTPESIYISSLGSAAFTGNLFLNNTSTGLIRFGINGGNNSFAGNITVNNTTSQFFEGAVTFTGNNAQQFSSTAISNSFNALTMNKLSGALTLNAPVTVSSNLVFTKGNIITTQTNLLKINDDAIVSAAGTNSFVEGPIAKQGDDPFTFPTGKAANYQPITITAPQSAGDIFMAEYFNEEQTLGTDKDASLQQISTCEYWNLDRTAGTSSVSVTLGWNQNSCDITQPSDMRVAGWDGAKWADHGNSTSTGDQTNGAVTTASNVNAFGAFTLGTTFLPPLSVCSIEDDGFGNITEKKCCETLQLDCIIATICEGESVTVRISDFIYNHPGYRNQLLFCPQMCIDWDFFGIAPNPPCVPFLQNTAFTLTFNTAGTYPILARVNFTPCGAVSSNNPVKIVVLPKPLVDFNLSPSVLCQPNQTVCLDGIVSPLGTNFSWFNNSNQIFCGGPSGQCPLNFCYSDFPAPGTYNINLTATNQCGSDSKTKSVIVNEPIIVSAGTDKIICTGDIVTLGILPPATMTSGGTPPYTFSWSPSINLSCPGGAGLDCPNPTANPIITTTYTVTVTDALGCSSTATTVITPKICCPPQGPNNIIVPDNTLLSSMATVFPGSVFSGVGKNILVNGTFIIDKPFTFTNATFFMAPQARININSSQTLTLDKCNISSCDEMWDRILITDNTAKLITLNSAILDAENAIVSQNGGVFEITSTTLDKNFKHVVVLPYAAPHTGFIKGSKLLCTGGYSLKLPHNNQRTETGVEITGLTVGGITIGVFGTPLSQFQNTFDNMDYGIRATQSIFTAINNKFQNIFPNVNTCSVAPCPGTAIDAAQCGTVIIGGLGIRRNYITNAFIGVRIKDTPPILVENNVITNIANRGIFIDNFTPSANGIIKGNQILNAAIGIHYLTTNPSKIFFLIDINSNSIQNDDKFKLPSQFGGAIRSTGTAILMEDLNVASHFGNSIFIRFNSIKNSTNGITTQNVQGRPQILSNNITVVVKPPFRRGINVLGTSGAAVSTNIINTSIPINPSSLTIRGITVQLSPNCNIDNNSITRMGTGMFYQGNNNPAVIQCNNMTNCLRGVVLSGTDLGAAQGSPSVASDNQWIHQGAFTPQADFFDVQTPASVNNIWYVRSNSLPFFPSPFIQFYTTITSGASPNTTCSPPCTTRFCNQIQLAGMLKRDFTGSFGQQHRFFASDAVFRNLKSDPSLMQMGTSEDYLLQNFYDSTSATNISMLEQVNSLIADSNFSAATSINAGIIPGCLIESNQKTINEILLGARLAGVTCTQQQIEILSNIADQCPLSGGKSVYQARILLALLTGEYKDYEDECVMDGSSKTGATKSDTVSGNDSNRFGKIFPNPNGGKMRFEYTLDEGEKGELAVYNLTGDKVLGYVLEGKGSHSLVISSVELPEGIFLYRIIINGKVILTEKLAIIR